MQKPNKISKSSLKKEVSTLFGKKYNQTAFECTCLNFSFNLFFSNRQLISYHFFQPLSTLNFYFLLTFLNCLNCLNFSNNFSPTSDIISPRYLIVNTYFYFFEIFIFYFLKSILDDSQHILLLYFDDINTKSRKSFICLQKKLFRLYNMKDSYHNNLIIQTSNHQVLINQFR